MPFSNIDNPLKYFNTTAYTGNGSAGRNLTTGTFQPDWVWIKSRSDADNHRLVDAVRGATKHLESDGSGVEQTSSNVTAFTSTGVTLSSNGAVNANAETYVAWSWLGANTTVSNTSGTITSTVSANTTSGFSIVSYTGNGTSGATFGHGLGTTPAYTIVKNRSSASNWMGFHQSLGNTKSLLLNSTEVPRTNVVFWNNTSPTSTLITLGNDSDVNTNGNNYIAYCFAEVKGYSKAFSYTGNGSSDGTFVSLGFRPAWLLIKRTDSSGYDWLVYDNKRQVEFNVVDDFLKPNLSDAETTGNAGQSLDFLSNGIKFRGTGASSNASGGTYIGFAIAEQPFVSSKGIVANAR